MTIFDKLIDLIEPLKTNEAGEWIFDNEHSGTKDDPKQMPFVHYSDVVMTLISEVGNFVDANPDYNLTHYNELLNERGLKWNHQSLEEADVSEMDAQGILAMLVGLIRGERFCEGALMGACKSGSVVRWLERLKTIIEQN